MFKRNYVATTLEKARQVPSLGANESRFRLYRCVVNGAESFVKERNPVVAMGRAALEAGCICEPVETRKTVDLKGAIQALSASEKAELLKLLQA